MEKIKKFISLTVSLAFLLSFIGNSGVAFAEDNPDAENSIEAQEGMKEETLFDENLTEATILEETEEELIDEIIPVIDETTSNEDEITTDINESTTSNETINNEDNLDEVIIEDVSEVEEFPEDTSTDNTNEIETEDNPILTNGTSEEVCENEHSEETTLEEKVEEAQIPSSIDDVEVYSIEPNGTSFDFSNPTTLPTITLNVDEEFKENISTQIKLVNINDTSKIVYYTSYGNNVSTFTPQTASTAGTYEIASVEIRLDTTLTTLIYINPKYKDIITSSSTRTEYKDFAPNFQLEIINFEELEYSFENFSVPTAVSNGNYFTPTVTIKSNKEITGLTIWYKSDNDSVVLYDNSIVKDGDNYTISPTPQVYAEGYTPLEYLRSGTYSVYSMTIEYKYDSSESYNTSYLLLANITSADEFENDGYYDFSALNIICNNPNEDLTPPVINSITMEKNIINLNEVDTSDTIKINISADVIDNLSGFSRIDTWMVLVWKNPNGEYSLYTELSYNESSRMFEGYVSIYNDLIYEGTYTLDLLSVWDVAYNSLRYERETDSKFLSNYDITLTRDNNSGNNNGNNNTGNSNNNTGNSPNNNSKPNDSSNIGSNLSGNNSTITVNPTTNNTSSQASSNNSTLNKTTLPYTGSPISSIFIIIFGSLISTSGFYIFTRKKY